MTLFLLFQILFLDFHDFQNFWYQNMNLAGTFFLYSAHTVVTTIIQSLATKISCLGSYLAIHSMKAYFIPFTPYEICPFILASSRLYFVGQIQPRGNFHPAFCHSLLNSSLLL